jgi:hypothetical protein
MPPTDIGFDGFAVRTHCLLPSRPLMIEEEGIGWHHLSLRRGSRAA